MSTKTGSIGALDLTKPHGYRSRAGEVTWIETRFRAQFMRDYIDAMGRAERASEKTLRAFVESRYRMPLTSKADLVCQAVALVTKAWWPEQEMPLATRRDEGVDVLAAAAA